MELFPDDCIIFFYCYFVNQTLLGGVLIDLALYWYFSFFSIVMGGWHSWLFCNGYIIAFVFMIPKISSFPREMIIMRMKPEPAENQG